MVLSKILVDIKLYSNSFNNRVTFVVIGSRLCGYNSFGERLSTILTIKAVSPKVLVDFKLYANGSNNINTIDLYGTRVCCYNLSSDRLSTPLMVEAVS